MVVLLNSMNRAVMLDMAIRDIEENIISRERVDVEAVQSLPVEEATLDRECAVCLEANLPLHRLECGHAFCISCLESWLIVRNACPMCRANAISSPSVIPTEEVRASFRLLRQLVYAMMCEDARVALWNPLQEPFEPVLPTHTHYDHLSSPTPEYGEEADEEESDVGE